MPTGFRLFVDLVPASGVILIVSLIVLFRYRKSPVAPPLIIYVAAVLFLLAMNTAELLAPAGEPTKRFAILEYLAFVAIPMTWLSFGLRFTGWITRIDARLIWPAILVPLCAFAVVATNGLHGLFWVDIDYFESEGLSVLKAKHGPLFWVIWLYCWSVQTFGGILILRSYVRGQHLYQKQSLWIIVGILFPAITNTLFNFRVIPGIQKDFTPIGYALSALCFIVGIFLHRLLWVMPVSRSVMVEQLRIGILAIDRKGRIVDHNPAADRMLELPEILVGESAADQPALMGLFEAAGYAIGTIPETTTSKRVQLGANAYFVTIQRAAPQETGVVIVIEDVTSQAALESDMNRIKNEFARRERLVAIGQLSAGLAHEINNPLSYLKSDLRSLERLVERKFPESEDRDIKEIVQISEGITEGLTRIENVVRSLLDFTRQGKADSPAGPYDLHAGIDGTLEIMRYEYREVADIRREYGEIPRIMARGGEINQAIFNILTNAIQAIKSESAPDGARRRGTITIRTGCSGNRLWCEIENDGPPIPPEIASRLFEIFFTTKADKLGTGLGLNYSQDVVEHRNHGRLFLASRDPVVFRMELPATGAT